MFEKLLQRLLKDVVGEFIDGIDTKKLNIGIWSGTVEIVNVSLKPRILALLGLPYSIIFSNISKLDIRIPWKNLFTAPLFIEIDSIQILAENSVCQLSPEQQGKVIMLKIKQFIQKIARDLATSKKSDQKEKQSGGYFETVYLKMLDNLYLTIRNIHFRFEVSKPLKSVDSAPFSFGLTLQSIQLFAVDQKSNKIFIDRSKLPPDRHIIHKKLQLQNLGFYWNFEQKDSIFLSTQALNYPLSHKEQKEKYLKNMMDIKQIMQGSGLAKQKINYIIMINAEGLIKEDNRVSAANNKSATKYEVSFNMKGIKMIINQKIVKQVFCFLKETAFISNKNMDNSEENELAKWQGPKNQAFLVLLRKYCIGELIETENTSNKSSLTLTSNEEKFFIEQLYENRNNFDIVEQKVKEIIVSEMGSKNAISQSDIMKNWQKMESILAEQKNIEGNQNQLKFFFQMGQLSIFYVDEVKIPIIQFFVKNFAINAQQNQNNDLLLKVQVQKLQGFGYDQNSIIIMEHEVQIPFQQAQIMKYDQFLSIIYKVSNKGSVELDISLGGIGLIYDFKTFHQLSKLSQSLISPTHSPDPLSPCTEPSPPKSLQKAPEIKSREAPAKGQLTMTVEKISMYIQQQAKKTYRLSLSNCQVTNSTSLFPQNILVSAVSVSLSDTYILPPTAVKLFIEVEPSTLISAVVEPLTIKLDMPTLGLLKRLPGCLGTYRKNDAISLSSKYGQLYLFDGQTVWSKYDAVVIQNLLYLYHKNEEYSHMRLHILQAHKKKDKENKRDVIQVVASHEGQQKKFYILVRGQAQFEQWHKYLTELAALAKPIEQIRKEIKPVENQSTSLPNMCIIISQLDFVLTLTQTQQQQNPKQESSTSDKKREMEIKFVLYKTILETVNKQMQQSVSQSSLFQSFTDVPFEPPSKKQLKIQSDGLQLFLEKNSFINLSNSKSDKTEESIGPVLQQDNNETKMKITLMQQQTISKVKVDVSIPMNIQYHPHQIIKLMALLQNVKKVIGADQRPLGNDEEKLEKDKNQTVKQNRTQIEIIFEKGLEFKGYNMLSDGENKYPKMCTITAQSLSINLSQTTKVNVANLRIFSSIPSATHVNSQQNLMLCPQTNSHSTLRVTLSEKVTEIWAENLFLPEYSHSGVLQMVQYLDTQVKESLLNPRTFNMYHSDGHTHTRMYRLKECIEQTMTQREVKMRIFPEGKLQVQLDNTSIQLTHYADLKAQKISVTSQLIAQRSNVSQMDIMLDEYIIRFDGVNLNIKVNQQEHEQDSKDQQMDEPLVTDMSIIAPQEQVFYTVLNRFTVEDKQLFKQRTRKSVINVIDEGRPFDFVLTITMFGKYPEYKTLHPDFDYGKEDVLMTIKIEISEIFMILFPKQADMFIRVVQNLLKNINTQIENQSLLSYDKRVLQSLLNTLGEPREVELLPKQEYMSYPINFLIELKCLCCKFLIPPTSPSNNQLDELELYLQNVRVVNDSFPKSKTQVRIGFAAFGLNEEQKEIFNIVTVSIIDPGNAHINNSDKQSAFIYEISNEELDENQKQNVSKSITKLWVSNVGLTMGTTALKKLFKFVTLFQKQKICNNERFKQIMNEKQIQLEEIVRQKSMQVKNKQENIEIHPIQLYINGTSVEIEKNFTFEDNQSQQFKCTAANLYFITKNIIIKMNSSQKQHLNLQVEGLEGFIEQIKQKSEIKPIKKYSMSFSTSLPAREKNLSLTLPNHKTILQPTKVIFRKEVKKWIQQKQTPSKKQKKKELKQNSSRLKSFLNFSQVNEPSEQKQKQEQQDVGECIVQQLSIQNPFLKFSLRDLQIISSISSHFSSQLSQSVSELPRAQSDTSVEKVGKKQSKFIVNVSPVEIILFNENDNLNKPLIYAKIQINDRLNGEYAIHMAINYLNLRINLWEPLLQPYTFLVLLQPNISISALKHSASSTKEKINSTNQKDDESVAFIPLQLNVSTNFLESLMLVEGKNKGSRLSEVANGDQVNCWVVVNQLGYDIELQIQPSKQEKSNQASSPKPLLIKNSSSRKLPYLQEQLFSKGIKFGIQKQSLSNNKVKVSLNVGGLFKIKDVQIGEVGTRKFLFTFEGKSYWINRHTSMDISKNVRYIKFYSGIIILNETNLDLWMVVENAQQNEQVDQDKNINDSISKSKISVQSDMHSQYTEEKHRNPQKRLIFRLPANKKVALPFDLDQNLKKLSESKFAKFVHHSDPWNRDMLKFQPPFHPIIQKSKQQLQTAYTILPTGKIINKLPQGLHLAFKKEEKILYEFSLLQDQYNYIYAPFSQLQISVHSDKYQWSNFVAANNIQTITLLDFSMNKLPIKVNYHLDQSGVMTAIFYPLAVLYNDSDYEVSIKDPENKNSASVIKVQSQQAVSLSNPRFLIFKPKASVSPNWTPYTKISIANEQVTCNFPLSPEGQPLVPLEEKIYEQIVVHQISLQSNSHLLSRPMGQNVATKFVTISHRFVFQNKTQQSILLRKYPSSTGTVPLPSNFVRTFPPMSKTSVKLSEQELGIGKTVIHMQLTIEKSSYEWSGAISLTHLGKTDFVLRNRSNFNDIKFMCLDVIKYHKIDKYSITLSEVPESQAPFVLCNNWPGAVIKMVDFVNRVVNFGEKVPFSWDQPLLNPRTLNIFLINPEEQNKTNFVNKFVIKIDNAQEGELIKFKRFRSMGEVKIIENQMQKIVQIREYKKEQKTQEKLMLQVSLPIRVALINNSFSPVYHLCDISTNCDVKINKLIQSSQHQKNGQKKNQKLPSVKAQEKKDSLPQGKVQTSPQSTYICRLNLNSVQVDNHTRHRVYFPVVMSTSLSVVFITGKEKSLELSVEPIVLNIQQDFARDFYATIMLISSLFVGEGNGDLLQLESSPSLSQKTLIQKLSLPPLTLKLQIKTKKLSIETTVNLERPPVSKYPFSTFPYPIKNIIINLLSHLSISPWSVISSFQKGIVMLLTEQESVRGIESFFGQILAALSNSVNGLIGILVGHDIERVEHFFDGIQQGASLFVQQILEIKTGFEVEQCTPWEIFKALGVGIAYIVFKPMKGVLQMTLKISEGIKKTALYSFEEIGTRFRQRDMIVFYGEEQHFETYNPIQSEYYISLLKVCGQPLKYFHLQKFYQIQSHMLLALGSQRIILLDMKKNQLIWQLSLHQIQYLQIQKQRYIAFYPSFLKLETDSVSQCSEIYSELQHSMNDVKNNRDN